MDSNRDDLNQSMSSRAGSQLGKTIDIQKGGKLEYFRGGDSRLNKTQKVATNRLQSSKDEQLDVVIEKVTPKGKGIIKPRTRASFINKSIEAKQIKQREEAILRGSMDGSMAILEEEPETRDVGC